MKSIFKKVQRKFDVSVHVEFLGSKTNLSVPVSAFSKREAKKMAKDIVLKRINVSSHSCKRIKTRFK